MHEAKVRFSDEGLNYQIIDFFSYSTILPRLSAAEGLLLFGIKKKQKMPAENFSFEASKLAWSVEPEKFVRPELNGTEKLYFGLAKRKCICKYPSKVTIISSEV
ncbi:hypothetical protein DRW42_26415 [Pedobacter miscanthi]|uniref:Uncharacterized protein n=1 Tax=Pedobacter miscanthi TaxID=2259170 RepID=A0A366KL95_9SPHI|nr:hypothetical protein DRW42_26415 [Pedobacter miscanthi]